MGGSLTTIDQYPYAAPVLVSFNLVDYTQSCGSSILTSTAILSAAHCFDDNAPVARWRVRVGSSFGHSGGTVHILRAIFNHPGFTMQTLDNDIAVLRTQNAITFIPNTVAAASIAGSAYNLADNQPVWAIGWGNIGPSGPPSEQLRHVQLLTVNQQLCQSRYGSFPITANMLCVAWFEGGRDQCSRDSGSPLLHFNVVVGVCSFGSGCFNPNQPTVNARVSRYTSWIQAMAA
ncbi:Trypsin CFT-1 [Eumeta japonica]|uniref:Trypsin CFT-1 n=1 Tax=Eumeta variegata TaxID=151549 RepID=A0A4C1WGE0_EUMVA|nr:Trypsin CFT-1 [Eumeta japonica]